MGCARYALGILVCTGQLTFVEFPDTIFSMQFIFLLIAIIYFRITFTKFSFIHKWTTAVTKNVQNIWKRPEWVVPTSQRVLFSLLGCGTCG